MLSNIGYLTEELLFYIAGWLYHMLLSLLLDLIIHWVLVVWAKPYCKILSRMKVFSKIIVLLNCSLFISHFLIILILLVLSYILYLLNSLSSFKHFLIDQIIFNWVVLSLVVLYSLLFFILFWSTQLKHIYMLCLTLNNLIICKNLFRFFWVLPLIFEVWLYLWAVRYIIY